ncbi:hypothetical protein J8L88_15760 [Aquimarina sp. MMG015]|uniref:hypothetical protein n=1 Tax=Aquimarina sp. MMG015 TaxID=2822689 RepID=UPI001B3A0A91|nr:hypothetical protein [Aquimarina sp. MMG015]MBQ4804320.1 hypothetical protein [Aquimarina sp. MMG015]
MKKIIFLSAIILGTILNSKAQTQTQDLNMGLNQLQFPSANGGFNRVQSFGGTFPGKWLFKSRFDDIYLDAGENSGNKYKILFLSGGIERARMDGDGKFGIGTTNPTNILSIEKNQNGSTLLEINNSNSGNSARRGIIIGEGTPGKSVYLLSTSSNYNQVNTWANAGVLGTDSQLSNGLIMRSASGKIRFQPNGISDKIVFDENGNIGIGTTNPDAKLSIYLPNGTASYPTISDSGNLFLKSRSSNSGMEFGNSAGFNDRKAWIIARHTDVSNYGKYYSTLHLQPDVGDKSQYRGVSIGYEASTQLPINTHLAVSGNVGIGTTDPNFALDVSGTSKGIKLGNATENLLFRNNIGGANEIRSYGLALEIETRDTQDISFNSNNGNSKLMIIKGNGSGIGIGTTNPTQKLQVDAKDSAIQIQLNRTGSNTGKVDFGVDNNGLHYWVGGYDGFGKEEFLIGTNGNIGIGTNTPDAKLAVNGNIHTKEVKVDLVGWPDYVFEDSYNLPSLQEVENHITEKGHLENIPSATEVAENGIQLGEMNKKLLQKIEELTLYMIEQNKKTDNQQKEIYKLQEENKQLQSTNSMLIELQMRLEKLESKLNN